MTDVVIVGGGVAGLVAALALRKECRVTLVERAPFCGGLMRSYINKAGIPFDFGTHFMGETGSKELDSMLYDRIRGRGCTEFKIVRAGNYFAGKLNRNSPHIDARSLPKDLYEQGARELLAATESPSNAAENLQEHLIKRFGPTLTEHIHEPVMRKIFGCGLKDMLPDNPFALKRVIAFDAERSRELKKVPFNDDRLAFTTNEEGAAHTVWHFYPKKGCVGQWTDDICADLERSAVRMATGRFVNKVVHDNGEIKSVELDNGESLACSRLIWSVAPFFLLKAMGIPTKGAALMPRPTGLFHFVFDRPFLVDNHYVLGYDSRLKSFRATLYPNLNERQEGPYNCTVEVIGSAADAKYGPEIRAELEQMGIVDPKAKTVACDFDLVAQGFPTLTHDFVKAAHAQVEQAKIASPNVTLIGRAKFDAFSIEPVALLEAFQTCKELLPAPTRSSA